MTLPITFANLPSPVPLSYLDQDFQYLESLSVAQVTPETFGAIGNGIHDDYQAITDAGTAAAATGGVVVFTQGKTYRTGTAILMQSGVTYRGPGRPGGNPATAPGAKIVSSASDVFTNSNGLITAVTFDGLWIESETGGGHVFNWNPTGELAKIEVKNCVLVQGNANKAIIDRVSLTDCNTESIWMHDFEMVYQGSNTVPAIRIRGFTVNGITIDTFWSTAATLVSAGTYAIWIEPTNASGYAFTTIVKQGTFENATGGGVNLLSHLHSGVEQCVSYDIGVPIVNPFIRIAKGSVSPASNNCWVKGSRSQAGSATVPDCQIDCQFGGVYSVTENSFYVFDGVSASGGAQLSMRGYQATFNLNVAYTAFGEGVGTDLLFGSMDDACLNYSISNGYSGGGTGGYLNIQKGPTLVTAGSFVSGQGYQIVSVGSTDFTLIGAASNTVGLLFFATGAGAGTGTARNARPTTPTYLGGVSPTGLFQWGGAFNSPLFYITAGGQCYPKSLVLGTTDIAYSASMTFDNSAAHTCVITATNNTAFTVQNPLYDFPGQFITFIVRNTSGGALGTGSWGAKYKMAAWVQPANGFSASISFDCRAATWIEVSRSTTNIPN